MDRARIKLGIICFIILIGIFGSFVFAENPSNVILIENTKSCLINCYFIINITNPTALDITFQENSFELDFEDKDDNKQFLSEHWEKWDEIPYQENVYTGTIYFEGLSHQGDVSLFNSTHLKYVIQLNSTFIPLSSVWNYFEGEDGWYTENHSQEIYETIDKTKWMWVSTNLVDKTIKPGQTWTLRFKSKKQAREDIKWSLNISQLDYYLDPWWNGDWQRKKEINITENSGTTFANYSVLLNLSVDIDMHGVEDLRFTNSSETGELNHWVFSNDTNDILVWVKIPTLTGSSDTQIYVYYDNSGVSSTSDITTTFLAGTDCEYEDPLANGWTKSGTIRINTTTDYQVTGNRACVLNTSENYPVAMLNLSSPLLPTDLENNITLLEQWVRPLQNAKNSFIPHIANNPLDDNYADAGVSSSLSITRDTLAWNWLLLSGWVAQNPFSVGIWQKSHVYYNFTNYVNNWTMLNADGSMNFSTTGKSYKNITQITSIAWVGYWNDTATDNIILRKYTDPEPTYIIGAEESTDIIPPNVTINQPLNQTYNTKTILFNVTALDEIAMKSCNYTLNNGLNNFTMSNLSTSPTQWTATNSTMSEGSHTVIYYCTDTSDRINNSETIDFYVRYPVNYTANISQSFTINTITDRLSSIFKLIPQSFFINTLLEKTFTELRRIATDYFKAVISYSPSVVDRLVSFFRNPFQDLNLNTLIERIANFFRKLFQAINLNTITERIRQAIRNIIQFFQMLFSIFTKGTFLAWNWITSTETTTQRQAIEQVRVPYELNDTWVVSTTSPENWTNTTKTYNLPADCGNVQIDIDNVNMSGSMYVNNTLCDYTLINNRTLEPTHTSWINISYTTGATTSAEGDWIASNKRLYQNTSWINTLTMNNPTIHDYVNISINMTTDKEAHPTTINVTNSTDDKLTHAFDNTNGNIDWNLSKLDSGDTDVSTIEYKTNEINITKTKHNETISGKDYEIHNITIDANSTRSILSVYSYFNFSDENIISNKFYKCDNGLTGCDEDISNRIDVVWDDLDSDGNYDYVEWFVTNLTQNHSYQLHNDKGLPVVLTETSVILNSPIFAFDNILWKTTITMYNPNAFATEKVYKYEFPLGSADITLDDISKNLEYPITGGLAPYVTIIDKDDSTHTSSVYLAPGETKTFIVEYRTESVTVYASTYFPDYFEVEENALIVQTLRINNQAESNITDIEYRIPIDYAEDLTVCETERKGGCIEDDTDPQYKNLTIDTQDNVDGDYKLQISEMESGETMYVTLSYYTPTAKIISIEKGRRSVQGSLTAFKKITLESQAKFTLGDLRYREKEIKCENVVDILKCRPDGICDINIGYECPLRLKLGSLGIGESITAYIWYVEKPEYVVEEPWTGKIWDWFLENVWDRGRRIELEENTLPYWLLRWVASTDPTTGEIYVPIGRLIVIGSGIGLIIGFIIMVKLRKFSKLYKVRKVNKNLQEI